MIGWHNGATTTAPSVATYCREDTRRANTVPAAARLEFARLWFRYLQRTIARVLPLRWPNGTRIEQTNETRPHLLAQQQQQQQQQNRWPISRGTRWTREAAAVSSSRRRFRPHIGGARFAQTQLAPLAPVHQMSLNFNSIQRRKQHQTFPPPPPRRRRRRLYDSGLCELPSRRVESPER